MYFGHELVFLVIKRLHLIVDFLIILGLIPVSSQHFRWTLFVEIQQASQFLCTFTYFLFMVWNSLLHHFGVGLFFYNLGILASVGKTWFLDDFFFGLFRSVFVSSTSELKLLLLLKLVNNIIRVNLNLFKNIIFIGLCLYLDRLVNHFS